MTAHHHSHKVAHRAKPYLSGALVVALIIFAVYAIIAFGHTKPQSQSPEPYFTDASASGLKIVPASGGSSPAPTCTVSYTPNVMYPGDSTNVVWTSTDATGRTHTVYKDGVYFGGPYNTGSVSGSVTVSYTDIQTQVGTGNITRVDTVTGPGGTAYCSATVTLVPPTPPTCTLSVSPTTVNQPTAATLSWYSSAASTYYITNVSYVTPNRADSTSVAPSATTVYTGTATNNYGSTQCTATLTVNRSCTFNGGTVLHGNATTSYQAATVPYGSSCTSQTRTCTDGTLSGTYAYGSCAVNPPSSCTLDGQTVAHGASQTFYSQQTATGGQLCSSYAQSRTCTNGTLSGSASYQYANCSCAASYSCSGSDITYTNASCSTSTVASCASPSYCSAGLSSCVWPPITVTPTGSFTGHLEARPSILRTGATTHLYWNVTNALSCTVSGGGQTWNTMSSGISGVLTNAISERTVYTLACVAGGSNPALNETVNVLVQPNFQEQ